LHRVTAKLISLIMIKTNRTLMAFLLFISATSEAKIIQILHTNDLHAALHSAGAAADGDQTFGGWAQLKTVMDELTASARSQNIETIKLDAGDFFEGTLSYFPDHGINVLRAFQSIGYDAASLGNHDWLMGAQNTNAVFGKSPFPFPLLSANSEFSPWLKNLNQQILPSTQIVRDGIKIGIVGLSTDEVFYKWITKVDSYKYDMQIHNYRDYLDPDTNEIASGIANEEAAKLRENNDLVIALTHIGFKEDKKLAATSTNIDLIVGGHSHTRLDSLGVIENANGEMVPIVQTGATGVFIGKILVEVIPGKKPQVLTYELVPVLNSVAADPVVASHLETSEKRIEHQYGAQELNKVVGHSETRLISGSGGKTAYSKFIVDAMKDTTGADIGLDLGEFHSNSAQPKGEVNLRKLMEMYPRKLNAEQNEGLYVYQFRIPGWALKLALNLAIQFGYDLSTSGIEFKKNTISDEQFLVEQHSYGESWKAKALTKERLASNSILINGRPLKLFKKYRVATPEFVVRGAYAISWLTRLVMRGGRPSQYTIWDASEKYLAKIKTIQDDPSFKNTDPDHGEYAYGDELIKAVIKTIQVAPEFGSEKKGIE
jgi:2',3'-cyclic-nucleotide 2'-phosphodiesterase (5'-nucleotidase family)